MKLSDITAVVEAIAPLSTQASWDNSGWQVLPEGPDVECTGVLVCVDATPQVVAEAADKGYNLVISHHPVLFNGIKRLTGATLPQRTVMECMRCNVALYSSHIPTDISAKGINMRMAAMLGLEDVEVLDTETGLGAIGNLHQPLTLPQVVDLIKNRFNTEVVRASRPADAAKRYQRIALCGGSGSEFAPMSKARSADLYLTSDTRHHFFVDNGAEIQLLDIDHWVAEECSRQIFFEEISEKIPNFAVSLSRADHNPIIYL